MSEHREFYRKKISSPGFLIRPSGETPFRIRDLSIDGFQAHFDHDPQLETHSLVHVRLPDLNLEGHATVMRIALEPQGGCIVGFLLGELAAANAASASAPADLAADDEELRF